MKPFVTKTYEIQLKKMEPGKRARFAVLTDLHGLELLSGGKTLYEVICGGRPDAVLVLGDMIVSTEKRSLSLAADLLKKLSEQFPVYYVLGNHESKMQRSEDQAEDYLEYERELTGAGICFLHNERTSMRIRGTEFVFYGLELPKEFFHKPHSPRLSLTRLEQFLGLPAREGVCVLLAHNPKYGNTYFSWGADLIFSGHYHGGVVRLGEHVGLTCPQFLLFPPYCCGDFHKGEKHMIVSAGLGEHTVPVRIHNPRELIFADICGKEPDHGHSGKA